MNAQEQTSVDTVPRMQEEDWDLLISKIKQREVIPVIGPDLIRVPAGDKSITYEHYVGQQLAQLPAYKLTESDLAPLGVTLEQATLHDVISVCVKKRPDRWPIDLHLQAWRIVSGSQIPVPQSLLHLARITDFDLLATSTFDPLLEAALNQQGPLETRVYRGSALDDIGDLQEARKDGRRFLYYLFGRAEKGAYDFAICEVELLRLLIKLHDAKYRPENLFDELREKHLLLLGVNFSDWLARFFLWLAKDRGGASLPNRELREYFADPKVGQDRSLVLFLEHFSDTTRVIGVEPEDFVAELYRRWSEEAQPDSREGGSTRPGPVAEMPKGALFLSYSRPDIAAVETLYRQLERAGISAWYDAGLKGGDLWEEKLRRYIDNCSFFVPLISMGALRRDRAEFRAEWLQAVNLDKRRFGTGETAIIPVIVDEDDAILKNPQTFESLPPEFARAQIYHCPHGEAGKNLIESLRALLQKAARSEG